MMRGPLPFTFEDRTAGLSNTDFDDIYDRRFFHVRRSPGSDTTQIFEMHFPASRHRGNVPSDAEPIIQLEFLPGEHLGTISFLMPEFKKSTLQMSEYLRKVSFFGPSSSRKFIGCDEQEYKWEYQSKPGQEWTCTTKDDEQLVAHYDLCASDLRYLGGSGSSLVINEGFANIAPEIVATCLIMRHIALYNL